MKLPLQIKSYNDDYFQKIINFNDINHQLFAGKSRELARKFSSIVFKNLDDWPYLYFTSGITEAINFLFLSHPTYAQTDDYRYVHSLPTVKHYTTDSYYYYSYPYAGNGKFNKIPNNKNLILDCSYIFASNLNCVEVIPENVEYILFGVSKSHNLSNLRSGWFFSKKKIKSFHVLQYDYEYLGIVHKQILDTISQYEVNFLYKKHKKVLSELYEKHKIEEPDTNLFGIFNNQKIPYYVL